MFLDTLYSRRSDGKTIQVLKFEVEDNMFRTHVGIQDGAVVISEWTICKGKNTGKANATTDAQQAMTEAQARWQKKINEKYSPDITKIDSDRLEEPMRANEFNDRKAKIFNPDGSITQSLYAQPKLDGVRCVYKADGPYSRKGKKFFAYPHIAAALKPLFDADPDLQLDGEFYNHDMKEDFEGIVSLVKKQTPTPQEIIQAQAIQYHVYDLPKSPNKFSTRNMELLAMWSLMNYTNNPANFGLPYKPVVLVETVLVPSLSSLDYQYDRWRKDGYEGQMVRTDTVYEWKRTNALLKRKEFMDAEFIVGDVIEGKGNRSGMAGYITLCTLEGKPIYTKSGEQAKANLEGNVEYYKRILSAREELIGKTVTLKFFRYNTTGAPYLPVMKAIRDYE